MPGNEVGDRFHNFFGQETSSQVPQHSQITDAAWHGMGGNPWAGNQGQIATPFISDLKNRSSQQSVADYQRGYGGQSSTVQHDLSFQQSVERAEHVRSQSQDQQPTVNDFFQGHQGFQTRQNETNFLGVDTEPDPHNLTPKEFSAFDSHQGNCPDFHKRNLVRMDSTESPVNFDFLGGQHQMSPQHPGTMQSLPRQPLRIGDMQLLQQQLILKQMQEFQRQRQLQMQQMQQQESTRQLNISNHMSSLGKHSLFSQSQSMINGIPVQNASGYVLQPEVMVANSNLQQHTMSPDMRGLSSGLGFSSEQNQGFPMMGMVPQQVDQSLNGVPISGTRVTSSHFSPIQVDKAPVQQKSSNSNSLMANQYMVSSNQVNVQEGTLGSRQGYHGRNGTGRVDSRGFDSGINLERLQQVNSWQSTVPAQEFLRRQDGVGPSESSQEKTVAQAVSSQNSATLDPTEERILYGSDDNLWDAFGNSNHVGSGGLNTESTDASSGALSSLQSGTWSALMQSAVAEASSVDVSAQDEWSGPGDQGNRQIRTVNDTGKQQTAWAGNSFQTGSTLNNPFHPSDNNTTSINSNEMQRPPCSGASSPHDESERSQVGSFLKFSQQKAAVEVSHNLEKFVHSPDAESSAKNISHPWANQSGFPLRNPSGQSFIRQNGWNFIDSASSSASSALKSQGNQNPLLAPSTNDQKSSIGKNSWRTDPVSNSAVGIVHAQSSTDSPPVNIPDAGCNSTPDFSSRMLNQDSSQDIPPRGNNLDEWKRVDPVTNRKGHEITGNHSLNMEKAHEEIESSGNNSPGNGAVTTSELDHLGARQNIMNSFTNASHYVNARGTNWKDTNNSGTFLAGQKLSSNAGKKPSVRKFQHHPMGDVDVDPDSSRATAPDSRSESTMQQISAGSRGQEEGHIRQSKLTSLSTSLDRGVHNYTPNKTMVVSQNMLELLHKADHSSETANSTYLNSSSQNPSLEMPEAEPHDRTLHPQQKRSSVSPGEKSRAVMVPMSLVQSFPRAHETSQGEMMNKVPNMLGQTTSIDHGRIPDAFSPGFPYSRSHAQDLQMRETVKEANANQSVNESFDKFVSQSKESNEAVDGSGSSQSGQALVHDTSRGTTCNDFASSVEVTHLDNFQNDKDSGYQFSVLEASSTSQSYAGSGLQQDGASKTSATLRTTTSSKNPSFGTPPFPVLSNAFGSNIQLKSNTETTSWPQKLEYQNPQGRGSSPLASGATSVKHGFAGKEQLEKELNQQIVPVKDFTEKMMSPLPGKESIINRVSDLHASSAVSTQIDIAAFGRSLRPNASLSQSYSLLHQVQDLKNKEVDPTVRSFKRLKASDGSVDPQLATSECGQQLFGHANMPRSALLNSASSSPDDPKVVGFCGRQTDEQRPNLPSQDMHEFGVNSSRNFADSNDGVSGRGEHSQISPQMAPSWFYQYGTFKNGQVLSTYDGRKVAAMNNAELALSGGRSSNRLLIPGPLEAGGTISDDASQYGLVRRSSTPLVSEEFSFPQLSRPDSVDMSLFVVRPKKRKSATRDFVPWHKEVIKIPHRLWNISLAQVEWAKAVNRLTDKVEDDGEIMNAGPPAIKSKLRLILTTQLMQLLLHPPPSWVMSADAISQYESVAHLVARSTLGDVCGSLSGSASDASPPSNSGNILPERLRFSKSKSDQYFSKVMEDLSEKTRKVEIDLLRLDRSMSILDLRVECEDLEKFSVINRFAKFHGPGQTAGAAADTSSSGSASNAQKAFLQRYVTALPFPKNIPDRTLNLVAKWEALLGFIVKVSPMKNRQKKMLDLLDELVCSISAGIFSVSSHQDKQSSRIVEVCIRSLRP